MFAKKPELISLILFLKTELQDFSGTRVGHLCHPFLVIIPFAPSTNFLENREVDALVEYVILKLHGHRFQNICPSMRQPPGLGDIQSDFRFFARIFDDFFMKIVKKSLLLYSFSYLNINFQA